MELSFNHFLGNFFICIIFTLFIILIYLSISYRAKQSQKYHSSEKRHKITSRAHKQYRKKFGYLRNIENIFQS